jgi:hypothetical protein
MIGGIGMALMERSVVEARNGRIAKPTSPETPYRFTPPLRRSWT